MVTCHGEVVKRARTNCGPMRRYIETFIACMFVLQAAVPAAGDTSPYANLKWRAIGPALSGGRMAAVAGTDADPFLYYAGAAGGGVWRSHDAGTTWESVGDSIDVNAIGAIAIAASNKNVVWVGTGESNPRSDVSWGDGVWLSTDGGTTWTHRGLERSKHISRILVDPHDANIALVGALGDLFNDSEDRGVYRTTDGGKTWTKTLYVGPQTGVSDMAWDPTRPNVVFAGMWQYRRRPWEQVSGGPDGGLYRSTDGGKTWTKLTGNGLPSGLTGRIGVAVGRGGRVYAIIQSKEGVLWRSDDDGNTWRMMSADTILNQRPYYFSRLGIDPSNANTLLVLSQFTMKSTDGARTFKRVGKPVHEDNHDMWWSRDGKRIVSANDGGVATSFDGGTTWIYMGNVPVGQVYKIGYDLRVPYHVCGGLHDNTTMCGPSDANDVAGVLNRDWLSINGGDGSFAWPDPLDPDLIWDEVENGQLGIFDMRSQQNVDVSPYPRDTNGIALAGLPYRWNWTAPVVFSPQDGHVAYTGANVVFKTSDRGRHWSVISPDLTRNEAEHQQISGGPITPDVAGTEFFNTITDIGPSPVQAGVLWVGTDDGLIHLTTDGGEHWKNVTMTGIGSYGNVQDVDASPHAAGTAFAAIDRHLMGDYAPYAFVTEDFGASWRSISSGLPVDQPVRVIRQDPRNPSILYAGLEQSLWISFDRGATWKPFQLDLPVAAVRDLHVQPVADDLIVGTHGRSLYILDDLTPIQELAQAQAAGTFLFQPRTSYLYWQWNREDLQDNLEPANVFVGDQPDVGVMINYYLDKPAARRPTIDIVDANGKIVRRLEGTHLVDDSPKYYVTNKAGIDRITWDFTENPPVKYLTGPPLFRGPDGGATVVPGRYTIALDVDGHRYSRSVEIKPDPRAPWTQADYVARHEYDVALNTELSQIDVVLNSLASLRTQMAARLKPLQAQTPQPALVAQGDALLARMENLKAEITSDQRNNEDSVIYPDKVREEILTLQILFSESQQPPFDAHKEQAARVHAEVEHVLGEYQALTAQAIAAFNAALRAAGLAPLKP